MGKSNLLEALTAIVAHVEGVQPLPRLPEVYPVSGEWIREFTHWDAVVEQLCKQADVTIERGHEIADNWLVVQKPWFIGSTSLGLHLLPVSQAALDADERVALANRNTWLRRLELVEIKALAASSAKTVTALTVPTSQPNSDTEDLDAETRAIAIIAKHTKLTSLEEVAQLAGCTRQYLSAKGKCLRFKTLWKMTLELNGISPARGSKEKDGTLEGWK